MLCRFIHRFLAFTFFVSTAAMLAQSPAATGPASLPVKGERPNVLFIAVDDLNDWVGALDNGHPNTQTPNMDRLASEGMLFSNAHCQAPLCGPSRASLWTGLYPATTGIYGQIGDEYIRVDNPARDTVFLNEAFSRAGYKTLAVGKAYHGWDGAGTFDEYGGSFERFGPTPAVRFNYNPHWFKGRGGTSTDWGAFPFSEQQMTDYKSAEWVVSQLEKSHDRPFFLTVGFARPHVPWYVPREWFNRFEDCDLELPPYLPDDQADVPEIGRALMEMPMMPTTRWLIQSNQWENMVEAYLASVAFVDDKIGRVLDALKASRYAENTIIILWSDHGYHLGEKNRVAKHSLWEESTRVPLIIAGSGIKPGQVTGKPVELIDLYPTLLEWCGIRPSTRLEGNSLVPLLRNLGVTWEHMALTTYGRANHAVRSEHFRYIRYEDGSEELYDHRNDPNEWNNLADDPRYNSVIERHREYLPEVDAPWAPGSKSGVNDYFVNEQNASPRRDSYLHDR